MRYEDFSKYWDDDNNDSQESRVDPVFDLSKIVADANAPIINAVDETATGLPPEAGRDPIGEIVRGAISESGRQTEDPFTPVAHALGVPQHVSRFLSLLDRDRAALAGAAYNLKTGANPLMGLYEGAAGNKDVSWGDVVGIPASQTEEPWYERAAKTGSRFALDALLDPKNLLFGSGVITKALGLSTGGLSAAQRIGKSLGSDTIKETIAGSQLGKSFMHVLPDIVVDGVDYHEAQNIINRAFNEHNLNNINRRLDNIKRVADAAESRIGRALTDRERFEAIESWGHNRPLTGLDFGPEFKKWEGGVVPSEYRGFVEAFEPARQMKIAARARRIAREEELGIPPSLEINEADINYMPQRVRRVVKSTPENQRMLHLGELGLDPGGADRLQREKLDWIDPETGEILRRGRLNDPRVGVFETEALPSGKRQFELRVPGEKPVPVNLRQASRLEKETAYPGIKLEESPWEAIRSGIAQDEGALAFYDTIGKMREQQFLVPVGKEGIRPGWKQLDFPGVTEQAPQGLANYLENLFTQHINPDYPIGVVGDLLKHVNESRIGQDLGDATTWWKRNVLASLGWLMGNVASNQGLIYEAGVPALKILPREAQAIKIQRGAGASVFPGISNKKLQEHFLNRDLLSGAQYGESARMPLGYGHRLQDFAEARSTKTGRTVAGALATVGEKYGQTNDLFFRLGGHVEDNARLVAAIDYLKENAPNLGKMKPVEQAQMLDRAAAAGKQALIDYRQLTPLEKQLKEPIPFYSWMRGVLGLTAHYTATKPQRLNRMGNALDSIFDTMSPEDWFIADPWMRESMPITGVGGHRFLTDEKGNPTVSFLSRFMPFGDVERAVSRPLDYLASSVNPLYKGLVEIPGNKNLFTGLPLDPIATGFLQNMLGPLTGQPYQRAFRKLFGASIPATWDYVLGILPGGRRLNEIRNLAPVLGLTSETYKTPKTGGEYGVWLTTGGKTHPFDRAQQMQKQLYTEKVQLAAIKRGFNQAARAGDQGDMDYYKQLLLNLYNENRGKRNGIGSLAGP